MSKSKIITPPFLKEGDSIAIISTARKISEKEIAPAVKIFKDKGYNVVLGENIYNNFNQFAGTDQERANDLQSMLDDENIKAIICSRGGYGSIKLIPHLNFDKFNMSPKWIIGYSDITVFHSILNKQLNVSSIHGTMPLNFTIDKNDKKSIDSLMQIIKGELSEIKAPFHHLNKTGQACGEIVGGNLSMLYSMRGTPLDIDTEGKILFIEDLDEYLYHVDRMMMNLKLGNKLSGLKGLIVGGMSDMNDNDIKYGQSVEEIILDKVSEYDYPVAFKFPIGHIKPNYPIILGSSVCLDVSDLNSSLSYQ